MPPNTSEEEPQTPKERGALTTPMRVTLLALASTPHTYIYASGVGRSYPVSSPTKVLAQCHPSTLAALVARGAVEVDPRDVYLLARRYRLTQAGRKYAATLAKEERKEREERRKEEPRL